MRLSLLSAAVAASLVVQSGPAHAEGWLWHRRPYQWLQPDGPTTYTPPGTLAPGVQPAPVDPNAPVNPAAPVQPAPMAPGGGDVNPNFAPLTSSALGDTSLAIAAPGYIDFAKPMNQIRLRYDAANDMNRPDRAEFFYAKCGCFPGAPGPVLPERSVDIQEASLYLEYAPTQRFSVFVDLPVRFINPQVNENATGFGDIRYGFKYAFVYDDVQALTLQVRGFSPTGDARRGLGTDHQSVEVSLLYYRQLTDKVTFYGELGEWIPIGGTDFAGNVLIYGAGVGYTAYQDQNGMKVTPLLEFVGWNVQSGQQFNPDILNAQGAGGTNIVNGKLGVRAGGPRQDVYVGYGRALTGSVWYEDIWRFEYRYKY